MLEITHYLDLWMQRIDSTYVSVVAFSHAQAKSVDAHVVSASASRMHITYVRRLTRYDLARYIERLI